MELNQVNTEIGNVGHSWWLLDYTAQFLIGSMNLGSSSRVKPRPWKYLRGRSLKEGGRYQNLGGLRREVRTSTQRSAATCHEEFLLWLAAASLRDLHTVSRSRSAAALCGFRAVELPAPVAGCSWRSCVLMRVKRDQESMMSMVLTRSRGSLDLKEIEKAVRGIFPEGRGSAKSQKEMFQAEDQGCETGVGRSGRSDRFRIPRTWIRRWGRSPWSIRELHGHSSQASRAEDQPGLPNSGGSDQRKLSGTVKGKLELLKAKTTCHLCRQWGHWKRECPNRKASSAANSSAGRQTAVAAAEGEIDFCRRQRYRRDKSHQWLQEHQWPENFRRQSTRVKNLGSSNFMSGENRLGSVTGIPSAPSFTCCSRGYHQTPLSGWWFEPLWKIWKSIGMIRNPIFLGK